MDRMKFYVIAAGLVVFVGVLLILYIKAYCQRKNLVSRFENEMESYHRYMENNEKICSRLFPTALLELLGVKSVDQVSTGLQKTLTAAAMSVNVLNYSQCIQVMTSEDIFTEINHVFSSIIPLMIKSGGFIDKFEKAGLTGIYMGDCENALTAAISMCEKIEAGHFSVGIGYGEIMIGVVGSDERISPVTMSESIQISEALQQRAEKYGARILAASEFTNNIERFERKFNSRLLGYFFDSTRNQVLKVFDVYDGDDAAGKQNKRKTRLLFEQGVAAYIRGTYEEARLYFVEVLKVDRNDLAARQYLYMCDTFCNHLGELQIYIEKL